MQSIDGVHVLFSYRQDKIELCRIPGNFSGLVDIFKMYRLEGHATDSVPWHHCSSPRIQSIFISCVVSPVIS